MHVSSLPENKEFGTATNCLKESKHHPIFHPTVRCNRASRFTYSIQLQALKKEFLLMNMVPSSWNLFFYIFIITCICHMSMGAPTVYLEQLVCIILLLSSIFFKLFCFFFIIFIVQWSDIDTIREN